MALCSNEFELRESSPAPRVQRDFMTIRRRHGPDGPTPAGNGIPSHRQKQRWPRERGFARGNFLPWVSAPTQLLGQEPWLWAWDAALIPDFAWNVSTQLALGSVGADRHRAPQVATLGHSALRALPSPPVNRRATHARGPFRVISSHPCRTLQGGT